MNKQRALIESKIMAIDKQLKKLDYQKKVLTRAFNSNDDISLNDSILSQETNKIINSNNVDEGLLKEFVGKVKSCEEQDPETCHIDADNYICELLTKLGYGQVVEEFEQLKKWYA